MNTEDRRAPGASRIAFDGLVEVGGTLGPSFEAHAVNVSEEGMQLRTAYLPELGQQVTCRFEAASSQTVIGSGEVVWCRGADKGGEFGIRFTEMDPDCVEALKRVCGFQGDAPAATGGKVRLYIEGLASPMRAKIRDSQAGEITVGSDLGFLQVGKRLDLENAQTGTKRPASIDRVDVDIDPNSHVPQLVVTLRYADVASDRFQAASASGPALDDAGAGASGGPVDDDAPRMRGAIAEQAARIGPAFERVARRVKTTIALLAKARPSEDDAMPRRTTAPAPGGGLRSSGRRVVRAEAVEGVETSPAASRSKSAGVGGRRAAIGASVMLAAVLGAVVLKRSHHDAVSPAQSTEGVAAKIASGSQAAATPTVASAGPVDPMAGAAVSANPQPTPAPGPAPASSPAQQDPRLAAAGPGTAADEGTDGSHEAPKTPPRPAPFANGPVHHGNILRLKMDGPVEAIEGAQQPTGFVVKLPGRRSLEAAAPLAARDSRIATIKVTNGPGGAELSVVFKENVPNYRVSARGDALVIALAPVGALETTVAKRSARSGKGTLHATHTRPER